MKRRAAPLFLIAFLTACTPAPDPDGDRPAVDPVATLEWGLVMHGGAGTITPDNMAPETEAEIRADMAEAMEAGYAVLADSGSAVDAVVAAIKVLEDSPHFNAGRGAVFAADGTNAMDASIMDGATRRAGAVAGVGTIRNPIHLARLVMDSSTHVMLSGPGAEEFGRLHGVVTVDPEYFYTERRWQQLQEAQDVMGTVGVVALARDGTLAAGTSTGGTTNKQWGRIGDSPIIGAGTYADDRCGVSGTGWGEYFIRNVVAYDICARMRYEGLTLAQAAHAMIMERLEEQAEDTGGVVALDSEGHVIMTFNTVGMYRGYVDADGQVETAIYR